jgi:hypothetical protein
MSEGDNTFYMTAIDQAGNASVPLNATITLDTIAPIIMATPASGVYAAGLLVFLTTSETSTIYYTSDGSTPTIASMVYGGPIAVASTSTLQYFAIDKAGNSEGVKTVEYTIDPTLPLETTHQQSDFARRRERLVQDRADTVLTRAGPVPPTMGLGIDRIRCC